jgi:RNA polymerase sigma-70 factor (ECF subfamily)
MLGQSKLAFRAPFGLHGNMPPAEHSLTSLSATDQRILGLAVFATTHWSVVLEAQGESAAAQKALEKLCRTYWRPIYGYVCRHGRRHSRRRRSCSELFRIVTRAQDLNSVRKEKGRLCSYLLASVKHFLADESRHAMALKRGKGQRLIPFDDIREGERVEAERFDRLTADQIYERGWAFRLSAQVMARLRDEYRSAGNVRFFDQIKKCSWTNRTVRRKLRSRSNSA